MKIGRENPFQSIHLEARPSLQWPNMLALECLSPHLLPSQICLSASSHEQISRHSRFPRRQRRRHRRRHSMCTCSKGTIKCTLRKSSLDLRSRLCSQMPGLHFLHLLRNSPCWHLAGFFPSAAGSSFFALCALSFVPFAPFAPFVSGFFFVAGISVNSLSRAVEVEAGSPMLPQQNPQATRRQK
jgi:hypothetical protein